MDPPLSVRGLENGFGLRQAILSTSTDLPVQGVPVPQEATHIGIVGSIVQGNEVVVLHKSLRHVSVKDSFAGDTTSQTRRSNYVYRWAVIQKNEEEILVRFPET